MEENNLVIIFTVTLFIIVLTMIFIYAVFIKKKPRC
jgi:cytochrome bd-type quinol oxidase subunit 2